MNKVATLILNRNLPDVTDKLYEHLKTYDSNETDVYVIESGSSSDQRSKYCSWYANWQESMDHGLRYARGMNFGLSELWKEGLFNSYDAFFLITNDVELQQKSTIQPMMQIFSAHERLGILSPCSQKWGEKELLKDSNLKFFWFIHNSAYLLRREFIDSIRNELQPDHMSFLFDGNNFRGYGMEMELLAKAYINDWAAAITTEVWAEENEAHLLNKSELIKTESFEENLRLYVEEGREWMRNKYGFNSRWSMQMYVKFFYDSFFEFHPEYHEFKI
jgi:hypothetical protein